MNFNNIELMVDSSSDNPLHLLRFIILDLVTWLPLRFLIAVVALFHLVLVLIQSYLFVSICEIQFFVRYSPIYFAEFYVILSCYASLFKNRIASNALKEFPRWKLSCTTTHVADQIKQESSFIVWYCILVYAAAVISCVFYMIPSKHDVQIYFVYDIFLKYGGNYEATLSWMYRMTLPVATLAMIIPPQQVMYATIQGIFQAYMLLDVIENINTGCEQMEEEVYQRVVRERLVFCTKRHSKITIHEKNTKELQSMIALYSIVSAVLGISILFYLYNLDSGWSWIVCLRVISITVCFAAVFLGVIQIGQLADEANDTVYETLIDLDWYNWNVENRKIYLFFLVNGCGRSPLRFSINVSVNYELGLSIVKAIYSTLSIMQTIRSNQMF